MSYLQSHIDNGNLHIITIDDGEKHKNISTITHILEECCRFGLDRKSMLIAFGGGIIGDITGFAAAIYLRGIDYIQIPTTLLAQVDSSVGGKTGVNNAFGKNLIGAFHQPKAVYIDPHFLGTLPERELHAGLVEVIKMAVCFDKDFFHWLCQNDLNDINHLPYAIKKSVQIKAQVVINDEKEHNERAKLNYGHTFGHIIENQTGYSTYLHGEAVAMGITMANQLALHLGLMDDEEVQAIEGILQKYHLPTTYTIKDIDIFYQQFFADKKSINNRLKFILPLHIGDSIIKDDIPEQTLKNILKQFK